MKCLSEQNLRCVVALSYCLCIYQLNIITATQTLWNFQNHCNIVSSRFLVLVFLLSWVKIGRNVVKVVKKMLYKLVGNSVLPTVSSLITRQIQMARKYFWARKRNVLHPLLLIFKMSNTTEILHFISLSKVPDNYSLSHSASGLLSLDRMNVKMTVWGIQISK